MSGHTTVHIEIHRVSDDPVAGQSVCRCSDRSRCSHAKPQTTRRDTEVMNITVRAEGADSAALENAINKAVKHIDAERP